MGYEGGYVRSDTCAVLGGDGAIFGGDREALQVGARLGVPCRRSDQPDACTIVSLELADYE